MQCPFNLETAMNNGENDLTADSIEQFICLKGDLSMKSIKAMNDSVSLALAALATACGGAPASRAELENVKEET
jgi:hypothetical protein